MDGISFTVHPWTLTPRAAAASGVPVVPRALGSPSACRWPPEALASPPDGRGRRGEGLPRPLLAGKNANETRALRRCKLWSAQDAAGRAWLPGDSLALPMGTRGQRPWRRNRRAARVRLRGGAVPDVLRPKRVVNPFRLRVCAFLCFRCSPVPKPSLHYTVARGLEW